MPNLLIRADASPTIGTGHVMRCVALAQAAQKAGHEVNLVCHAEIDWLKKRLKQETFPVRFLPQAPPKEESPENLLAQLKEYGQPLQKSGKPIWVVLDGYHFNTECQKAIMRNGYRLLVIDDYAHLNEYHCDILLNQNIGANKLEYRGFLAHKFLGPQYALLRQEFIDMANGDKNRPNFGEKPENILITLGGGNFIEYLNKIAADISTPEIAGRTIRIVQGAMNEDAIRTAFAKSPADVVILPQVDNMAELLNKTDLCITAGGSTCWELCFMKIPFMTVKVAQNQHEIVNFLETHYQIPHFTKDVFFKYLNGLPIINFPSVHEYSIIDHLNNAYSPITFKNATIDDLDYVFSLVNDPSVRNMSFNNSPIDIGTHRAWFKKMLDDQNPFLIAYYNNEKCGYVRCNSNIGSAEISIALDKEYRGRGLGKYILRESCFKIFYNYGIKSIIASIKPENYASISSFQNAYFARLPNNLCGNSKCINFIFPHQECNIIYC